MDKKQIWGLIAILAVVLVAGIILAVVLGAPGGNGNIDPDTDPTGIETADGTEPTGNDEGTDPTVPGGSESTKPEATTPSGGTESGSTDNPGNTGNTGNGGNTGSGEPTGPEISVDDGTEPSVGSGGVIDFDDLLGLTGRG